MKSARAALLEHKGVPTESGAYWMQLEGAEPDICWIHEGSIWFAPSRMSDKPRVEDYLKEGTRFYGPLPKPQQSETK